MPIQTYVSSLDLQYYSEALGCAIGKLGYITANDFYYGKKCANSNLRKLKLAMGYMDILEKYQPQNIETPATITISILTFGTGSLTLTVVNGVTTTTTVASDTNINQTLTDLQTALPTTSPVKLGKWTLHNLPTTNSITEVPIYANTGFGFTGNGIQVSLSGTGGWTFSINGLTYLQGGENPLIDTSNLVTEEQLQYNVLPAISQLIGVKLPPPGQISSSTPPNISLSTELLVETGDNFITELTDPLLTEY